MVLQHSHMRVLGGGIAAQPSVGGGTSLTLTVWSYAGRHQEIGLLNRTPIALSLGRGLSWSDLLFPAAHTKKQQANKQTNKQTSKKMKRTTTTTANLACLPLQKQDLGSAIGIISRPQDVNQYPQAQPRRRQGKRGGKRTSGRSGQRRKMRKAGRLSKRYFRIYSWNCANRGAVLEKMVYKDVVCLPPPKKKQQQQQKQRQKQKNPTATTTTTNKAKQNKQEAKTNKNRKCPDRPLVLQGFTVIQRHEGSGMAIVVWCDLSKTVSY